MFLFTKNLIWNYFEEIFIVINLKKIIGMEMIKGFLNKIINFLHIVAKLVTEYIFLNIDIINESWFQNRFGNRMVKVRKKIKIVIYANYHIVQFIKLSRPLWNSFIHVYRIAVFIKKYNPCWFHRNGNLIIVLLITFKRLILSVS